MMELEQACVGYSRLLLRSRGVVDVNAAAEGTLAWSDNDGGIFTRALKKTFSHCKDLSEASWQGFCNNLKNYTESTFTTWKGTEVAKARQARLSLPAELVRQGTQTPQIYHVPEGMPGFTVEEVRGRGLVVADVKEKGAAQKVGLRRGETVVRIDGLAVKSARECDAALDRVHAESRPVMEVETVSADGKAVKRRLALAPGN
jgi:predicted metalloprotease with PDZ domain